MIAQVLISALLILAGLSTLLSAALLGFFTSRVPTGSDGMGLIVPLATTVLAALAGGLATMWVAGRGGFDGTPALRGHPLASGFLAAALVGLAIMGAFWGWAEKHPLAHPLPLIASGLVLPIGFFVWLFQLTWRPVAWVQSPVGQGTTGVAALAVLAGLVTALLGLQSWWGHLARERDDHQQRAEQGQVEADRRAALGAEGRLREDLSRFSADAPLWTLVAGLPAEPDAALRAIWIERALQVPDFARALERTWTGEHGVYRHGCAALIVEMPAAALDPDAWAPWLLRDAERTAEDIRAFGDLKEHGYDDLRLHVLTLTRARARLQRGALTRPGFERLRDAVRATPAGPARDQALQALEVSLAAADPG